MEQTSDIVVELTRNFSGLGALITAGIGMLLILRSARSKGRKDALAEADAVEAEVSQLRAQRIADARTIYDLQMQLASRGGQGGHDGGAGFGG